MKFEASAPEIKALLAGATDILAVVACPPPDVLDQPAQQASYESITINDDEIYQIRERETGELSQATGKNIKPGDSIITDDGEFLIPRAAFKRT